jgi:hypothetical protein
MKRSLALLALVLWGATARAAGPTYVQCNNMPISTGAISQWKNFGLPNTAPSGSTILVFGLYGATTSPFSSFQTDKGDTFTVDKTEVDSGNGASVFWAHVAPTAGARLITILFSSTAFVKIQACLVNNIATSSPVDVTCGSVTSGTSLACGSMTTGTANDFVVAGGFNDGTFPNAMFSFTAGGGFQLFNVDSYDGMVSQYEVQSSAGAINPTITAGSSRSSFVMAGVAYKTASSGGAACPASGPCVEQVDSINFNGGLQGLTGSTLAIQFPCPSLNSINLIAIGYVAGNSMSVSSVASSPSNTWTKTTTQSFDGGAGLVGFVNAVNTSVSGTMTITFTLGHVPDSTDAFTITVWGISNAATSPMDGSPVNFTSSPAFSSGTVANAPNITTSNANELVTAFIQEDAETVTSTTGFYLMPDIGAYATNDAYQDGGVQHYYQASAGTLNVSWTFSAYEGGTPNIGSVGAQAIAWMAPAAATISNQYPRVN